MRYALKLILVAGAIAAVVAVTVSAQGTKYGDGVKLATAVPADTLMASPEAYVGKTLRVDGIVTNVCDSRGCWIELSDEKTGTGVRFKVEDGVIVFPLTAKGRKASAEGTFEPVQQTPEQIAKHTAEHKDHAGEVKTPTYQVRATGAVIY
jgi:hypothetical protein